MALPNGVRLHPLPRFEDERGSLAEIFSVRRPPVSPPVQWNLVRSRPGILRGMHVHRDRADYIVMLKGRMLLGLKDLRGRSSTFLRSELVEIDAERPLAAEIPVGVLHGFFFPDGGIHAYGLSVEWRPNTDIGCSWDDADLGLAWPASDPIVNQRDLKLGALGELLAREQAFQEMTGGGGA
jgi:dTDP-4-dehydrorhamnose 3,5-epimerase